MQQTILEYNLLKKKYILLLVMSTQLMCTLSSYLSEDIIYVFIPESVL